MGHGTGLYIYIYTHTNYDTIGEITSNKDSNWVVNITYRNNT